MPTIIILRTIIISCVVVLLATCESSALYNKTSDKYLTQVAQANEDSVGADLAIIEFDEFGMLWDRKQLNDTLALIKRRSEESKRGILLLTYIHGWKSNADPEDENSDLVKFRKTAQDLAKNLRVTDDSLPDHVISVYLGWRGITTKVPGLNSMTFWGRKRVAQRIASYQMRESLLLMSKATKVRPDSKVHMSGHSMGGMILARTLAPTLTTALMLSGTKGHQYMADLAILKNPALDGLSTYQFIDFLKRNGVEGELRSKNGVIRPALGPAIVSITSKADWVTRLAYPAGQILGNVITATDFRSDLGLGVPSQQKLSDSTLGHVDQLVSHQAWIEDGKLMLERVPDAYNDTPFWVIQVTEDISSSHSDVNNPRFNQLIKRLIGLNRLYDTQAQTWLRMTTPQ